MLNMMENFISKFVEYSLKYGNAIEEGKSSADKYHSKLMSLYKSYDQNKVVNLLKNLLVDSAIPVKLWAAAFLLKHDENIALNELHKLKKLETIHSITAMEIIDLWKKEMMDL